VTSLSAKPITGSIVALLAAMASPARAEPRDVLTTCQALVDRAAQSAPAGAPRNEADAELLRCRQVIRDWTLRESRMSVDENGRSLR
jgi:hypothetical protein